MSWNPEIYHKYQKERSAPFNDLMKLIEVRDGVSALDLGCGTGEFTQMVSEMLPNSEVLGIDSSQEMLERALQLQSSGLSFELCPIEEVSGSWDLIFSNAAIQWVDNHDQLVPKLISHLKPGGQLAVQLPANHGHPTQTLIADVASEEPYVSALSGWSRKWSVLTILEYAELLYETGAEQINVFEKIYPHILSDVDAIVDWLSGTALLPYLERLPEELHEKFLDEYRNRLKALYPEVPVFFPYQRIFFSARLPE